MWDPVPTYDLPGIDPDVFYQIMIKNSSNEILFAGDNITTSEFNYTEPLPSDIACNIFNVTVSAINIVGRTKSDSFPLMNLSKFNKARVLLFFFFFQSDCEYIQ